MHQGDYTAASGTVAVAVGLIAATDDQLAVLATRRARASEIIAEQLSLEPADRWAVVAAALVADLGHALCGDDEVGGVATTRAVLVDGVGPPLRSVGHAIGHRYERADGRGTPDGLRDYETRRTAQVLATADVLVDEVDMAPIRWQRRLEIMKDLAGSVLDMAVVAAAADAFASSRATARVDEARLDDVLAWLRRAAARLDAPGLIPEPAMSLGEATSRIVELLRRALPGDGIAVAAHGPGDAYALRTTGTVAELACMASAIKTAPRSSSSVTEIGDTDSGRVLCVSSPERQGVAMTTIVRRPPAEPFCAEERHVVCRATAALAQVCARVSDDATLERLAHRDPLTGVANRWLLDQHLELVFAEPTRDPGAAVVLFDVDQLKAVNDSRGHAAGDEILRRVAAIATRITAGHAGTLVARLGGDEFCILCPGAVGTEPRSIAETMVAEAAREGIGLSCGLAWAAGASDPAGLLDTADEAQYRTKWARRRQLQPAPGAPRPPSPGRRARRDQG